MGSGRDLPAVRTVFGAQRIFAGGCGTGQVQLEHGDMITEPIDSHARTSVRTGLCVLRQRTGRLRGTSRASLALEKGLRDPPPETTRHAAESAREGEVGGAVRRQRGLGCIPR